MEVLITGPSLDPSENVSGIAAVVNDIIGNNPVHTYIHFQLGRIDKDKSKGIFRNLKAWFNWFLILSKKKEILIHFNFALDKRSIIRDTPLILLSRIMHRKILIHLHGGEYLQKEKVPFLMKSLLRLVLARNEIKIVLSELEKNLLETTYAAQKVVVLPNCIDLTKAKNFSRSYKSKGPLNILFIGRIVKRKGIHYILEALSLLRRKGIKNKFILAGTGPEEEKFISDCKNELGSDFEYAHVVSGTKKTDLFKRSDVFLLPSIFGEGLPIALLEAMSFGLVPVVTEDGSMKSIIENYQNGIKVKKQSSGDISFVLEELGKEINLRKKIAVNARQYVFEYHNLNNYITTLNKIYSGFNL